MAETLKILIVDQHPEAVAGLAARAERFGNLEVVGDAGFGPVAVDLGAHPRAGHHHRLDRRAAQPLAVHDSVADARQPALDGRRPGHPVRPRGLPPHACWPVRAMSCCVARRRATCTIRSSRRTTPTRCASLPRATIRPRRRAASSPCSASRAASARPRWPPTWPSRWPRRARPAWPWSTSTYRSATWR